jgi:hypothetical protein
MQLKNVEYKQCITKARRIANESTRKPLNLSIASKVASKTVYLTLQTHQRQSLQTTLSFVSILRSREEY